MLHFAHLGQRKTVALANQLYFWKGMVTEIIQLIDACDQCQRHANFQQVLELYDLNKDPLEKHNIADKLPEMVKKLQRLGLDMYR